MSTDLTAARERLSHAADGMGTLDLGPGGASVPGSVRWQLAADIRLVLDALDEADAHVERLTEELDINFATGAAVGGLIHTKSREALAARGFQRINDPRRPATPDEATGTCDCFPTPDNPHHHPTCPASLAAPAVPGGPSSMPPWKYVGGGVSVQDVPVERIRFEKKEMPPIGEQGLFTQEDVDAVVLLSAAAHTQRRDDDEA